MPTRNDAIDARVYGVDFERRYLGNFNASPRITIPVPDIEQVGVAEPVAQRIEYSLPDEMVSAIQEFMRKLNDEYADNDQSDTISFDDAMGW